MLALVDTKSRKGLKWSEDELEELLRQRYIAGKKCKDISILGRDFTSIKQKLEISKLPTTEEKKFLQTSFRWTNDSIEKLKKMFDEKNNWTNEELLKHLGRHNESCRYKYNSLNNENYNFIDEKIRDTTLNNIASFIKTSKNTFTAVYSGAFTTNAFENCLLRVNNKLLLYRAINKPAYNSTIEYDINRLVISFDNSQLSIDIKKTFRNLV